MTEKDFLKKCEDSHCQYIYKNIPDSFDPRNKYRIHGLKNGYITEYLHVNNFGQYPMFDKLNYREYYPLKNLINGEQTKLL